MAYSSNQEVWFKVNMATAVAQMPQPKIGPKTKLELALQQVSDKPIRQILKEVIADLSKPCDHSWMQEEFRLSPAEFRVLQLTFSGKSRKEIARELGVSPLTISGQTHSIYKKCRVSRTSELMALALNKPHA